MLRAVAVLLVSLALRGAPLDLSTTVVAAPASLTAREKKGAAMLVEEVEKQTGIHWEIGTARPGSAVQEIAASVGTACAGPTWTTTGRVSRTGARSPGHRGLDRPRTRRLSRPLVVRLIRK